MRHCSGLQQFQRQLVTLAEGLTLQWALMMMGPDNEQGQAGETSHQCVGLTCCYRAFAHYLSSRFGLHIIGGQRWTRTTGCLSPLGLFKYGIENSFDSWHHAWHPKTEQKVPAWQAANLSHLHSCIPACAHNAGNLQ